MIKYVNCIIYSGNCADWLITAKTSVDGSYSNAQRTVCRSRVYPNDPSFPRWYKRSYSNCDPRISITDYSNAVSYGRMLYGEDNCDGSWATNTINKGGVYVYIRNGGTLDYHGCSLVHISNHIFICFIIFGILLFI